MTEQPIGQGTEGMDQGNLEGQQGSTVPSSINPAWNELLGVVPSQLHSQVTPHLQKWDQNFQTKINEVHSQYEPWKPFLEAGVAPGDVEYALGLLNALSENPTEVIKALQEWVGAENPEQQGQQFNQPPQQNEQFDDTFLQHPKVQEMQQALNAMAQIMLNQREQEQQDAADEELESDIAALKEQYGEFDEQYVLGVAMSGENFDYEALEAAVKQFQSLKDNILSQKRPPGPPVLGSGAAIPAEVPKPGNEADRRALVAQMLSQAAQQR